MPSRGTEQRWACGNPMKFNQAKCKVLHLGHGNPRHKHRLGGECIEGALEEKDLRVLVDEKLNMSRQCALAAQWHQKKCGQQVEGGDSAPLLCSGETPPGVLCPALESSTQKHVDLLKQVQQRATKMIRGLEHLSCEDRLRELGLFSLEKRRLWGDLVAAFHYLRGAYRREGEGLFIKEYSDRTRF
ncbi:hypothetical protein llap_8639 [Limosa lapponica baueri]|uniref:Rna-directed dna polymerase from mobile element jockey-like n=1 Tax=Limosa lapponica baueri TaxID=1758121 RepID=A0A2I0U4Q7_LIMLA|nr:hypothetical protein llap_8639 [Limosa lapponica baueri]